MNTYASMLELERNTNAVLKKSGAYRVVKLFSKVNEYKNIEYAKEWEYQLKDFQSYWIIWKDYPYREYQNNFREKLIGRFTSTELGYLSSFFEDKFNAKVINALLTFDQFALNYNRLLLGKDLVIKMRDKRANLINRIYELLKLNILEQAIFNHLENLATKDVQRFKVRDLLKDETFFISPPEYLEIRKQSKRSVYSLLGLALGRLSDHELEVFLNRFRERLPRGFTQLFVNFHHLNLLAHMIKKQESIKLLVGENLL